MADAKIRVKGDEETAAKIVALDKKIRKKVVGKAVNAGATPYLKAARKKAPRVNRYLVKSLEKKVRRYNNGASASVGQVRGRERQDKVVSKLAARKSHKRRGGGISGRGMVVPIHLVDQPVKRHRITPKNNKVLYGNRAALAWGDTFAARVNHSGHPGRAFMALAASASNAESTRITEQRLADEIAKEAPKP